MSAKPGDNDGVLPDLFERLRHTTPDNWLPLLDAATDKELLQAAALTMTGDYPHLTVGSIAVVIEKWLRLKTEKRHELITIIMRGL